MVPQIVETISSNSESIRFVATLVSGPVVAVLTFLNLSKRPNVSEVNVLQDGAVSLAAGTFAALAAHYLYGF